MGNTFSLCSPFRRRLRLQDSGHEKLEDPLPQPQFLFPSEEYPKYALLPSSEEPYEVRFCTHTPEPDSGRCACDEWTESRHWRLVAGLDDATQPGTFEALQPKPRSNPFEKAEVQLAPDVVPPRYALLSAAEMPNTVRNCVHVRYEGEERCDCDQWLESRRFRVQNGLDNPEDPDVRRGLQSKPRKTPTIRVKRRRYTSISIPKDNSDDGHSPSSTHSRNSSRNEKQ
ncbi:hypothetical protein A1Q2_02876 [Trichosporon asahii var. asahii CBS 8904]|uniref:Uncharacterized protein n=1 Tax=Trichosporon asahii var. asahii (strain CBS 8904) TaxID=1220162 RepID=K1VQB2_TRIAC|nr:hypothetical protein A1Q2_02876 [Trichosporon asahii var. asahii CBS 8904]